MRADVRCGMSMLAVTVCLLVASVASAAEHRENHWFFGGNMGGGSGGLHVGSESLDREIGAVFGLRGGYGFKPDLTVGLELTSWLGNVSDVDRDYYVFGPFLTWYPGDRDFFLRGAFGIGGISMTPLGAEENLDFGAGALATLGHEFHIVRTVTFTSQVDYGFVHTGENTWGDCVNLSLGFAWYPAGKE